MSRVLVTGGGGYIGSALVKELVDTGHEVICLDRFFFGFDPLVEVTGNPKLKLIKDDIRWFDQAILKDIDVVMDLAAMSNDAVGDLDPSKTFDINFLGRSRVARLCKHHGVKKYILASSTGLYGFQETVANETSKVNPLTAYSRAIDKAEEDVLPLLSDKFSVTSLRLATVYGPSMRMRFDLVVNSMVLSLFKGSRIHVMRDGTQWRPFIHIKDAVRAFMMVISSPISRISGEVYNVGSNDQNYQILPLAELVGKSLGIDHKIEWYGTPDFRSYRISFDKIGGELGFKTRYTIADGAREVYEGLIKGDIIETTQTHTAAWYKYLIECHNVSQDTVLRNSVL